MSSDIPVSENFAPVPGVKYDDEPAAPAVEPAREPESVPEPTVEPEKTVEPAKPEAEPPITERPKKASPIANLLEKKHEAETKAEQLEAENKKLQDQLAQLSNQPQSAQVTADIKTLAEKHGLDETILADIVNASRAGFNPELPKEVQDLIAERKSHKEQEAELQAFNARVDSLSRTFKDESFADPKVQEKLLKLAYSTEKAPDGEPYYKKELSELYFAYIKPEIEPGTSSAEPSKGGSKATQVIDFEEIYNRDDPKDIEAMDSDRFQKYQTWIQQHKESKSPIVRRG